MDPVKEYIVRTVSIILEEYEDDEEALCILKGFLSESIDISLAKDVIEDSF